MIERSCLLVRGELSAGYRIANQRAVIDVVMRVPEERSSLIAKNVLSTKVERTD